MEIIAHRGASHDAPENTLVAVQVGWAQGADAVEVDVHLTRDGRLAVIHDPDTQRTAHVRRVVTDATLAELRELEVGAWKEASFTGERIPALEEVFAAVPPEKRIFVEIKGGAEVVPGLQACISVARRDHALRAEQVAIISFDLHAAEMAKRALPQHEICWIADSGEAAPFPTLAAVARAARAAGLDGIDVDAGWQIDGPTTQQIRADGFKLYVWTVDDAALARRLAVAGVDGITTNRPAWLRAQLAAQ